MVSVKEERVRVYIYMYMYIVHVGLREGKFHRLSVVSLSGLLLVEYFGVFIENDYIVLWVGIPIHPFHVHIMYVFSLSPSSLFPPY